MSVLTRVRDRRLTGAPTRRQTYAFGASAFPVQLMAQTFAAFVVFFYTDHLQVPAAWVAAAMVAHGVLSAVLNPFVGAASDRARTAWGRRIPWIGIGIVPLLVSFALVWMPPQMDATALLVWFLIVIAVYDIATVAVVLNISALFPEIFRTTAERATGNTPRQVFGLVGMILGTAGAPLLYGTIGWAGMALCFVVICAGFFAWAFTGMIERPAAPRETDAEQTMRWRDQLHYTLANRAFVPYVIGSLIVQSATSIIIASVPFYVRYGLHAEAVGSTPVLAAIFVAALPALALWSRIVRRTSPRTALLWCMAVFGVAALGYLVPAGVIGAIITGLFVGVGVAGVLQVLEIALSQVIDDDEQRTGMRREGVYFGVNGFITRGSIVIQAVVLASVLTATGYAADLGDAQPESVTLGVRLLMGVVPPLACALAAVCFWVFPLRTRDVAVSER